jgi:hypothetical protein
MATKLPINSTDIASEAQFELADGKIVTLKTFCIEEQAQRVSIETLGVGDKFKTRNGEIFTIEGISVTPGGNKRARSPQSHYWFYNSGACASYSAQYDVIEAIPRTLLDLVDEQLAKLNKDDIDRIVLSEQDLKAIYGTKSNNTHSGLPVKYNNCYLPREFVFVFKKRK